MGSGFKDFAAGDVLTAADVDNYLMRQTVMVFATTSARDTALSGNLEEGMVAYNSDDDEFWTYDGSAWVPLTPHLAGVSLTRATDQTIGAGASSAIQWTAEVADTDGFIAVTSSTITIPTGLGGVYGLRVAVKKTGGSGSASVTAAIAGTTYNLDAPSSNGNFSASSWVGALSAADTISVTATESFGVNSVNVQAELELYRIGRV